MHPAIFTLDVKAILTISLEFQGLLKLFSTTVGGFSMRNNNFFYLMPPTILQSVFKQKTILPHGAKFLVVNSL